MNVLRGWSVVHGPWIMDHGRKTSLARLLPWLQNPTESMARSTDHVSDISRRDWLKTMGVVSAGALVVPEALASQSAGDDAMRAGAPIRIYADGDIVDLASTSDVYVPPRGRSWQKFSFDNPEPSVAFGGYTFGFLVFTNENTYSPARAGMRAQLAGDTLSITADGFTWAGGQEHAAGSLRVRLTRNGDMIEWTATVELERPIKAVSTIVRGVPRGHVSFGAGGFIDPRDNELLTGYPFGGGDLNVSGSMSTPLLMVQTPSDVLYVSSLDARVRPKRFYLAPGETSYRVEAIHEHDAWRDDRRVEVPAWRLGRAPSGDEAVAQHLQHVEQAYDIRAWETRTDAPAWMRSLAMVTTLHGQHYTGFVFNDYSRQLEILRWIAARIPADRVLAFLPAWDGRYYWDYPTYQLSDRMGGEPGFRRLIDEGHRLGFRFAPMFGTNAANRHLPSWSSIAAGATQKIDGDVYNLNWVDWNNDRHQDGWLTYMNLGAPVWRDHLESRIADMVQRYGVDAYFLDIVGGHVNSTTGDMHEGTRLLVDSLRRRFPNVACIGEMPYDALHAFIPMYQAGGGRIWQKYSRFYQHLSSPAPGRGSSGVHESGFGKFNDETLSLSPSAIPTLQVVDDTFTAHRDVMAAIIERAKQRAGIA